MHDTPHPDRTMNRLQAEFLRLYHPHGPRGGELFAADTHLIDAAGQVRAAVLELARPADWGVLAPMWRGVQTDLELPAPAIAVNGLDGYQLWFSLAEPVTVAQAQEFLAALRARYLGAIPAQRLCLKPAPGIDDAFPPVRQPASGHWSAFVLPDLAAVFADDPWLDVAPKPDAQADVLHRLESIRPAAFQQALDRLGPTTQSALHGTAGTCAPSANTTAPSQTPALAAAGPAQDPRQFLLTVMNDPCVDLHLRLEAAKALLPYCEAPRQPASADAPG